jgi:hypothetical protein
MHKEKLYSYMVVFIVLIGIICYLLFEYWIFIIAEPKYRASLIPVEIEITFNLKPDRVQLHRISPPPAWSGGDNIVNAVGLWEIELSSCKFDSQTHCIAKLNVNPNYAYLEIETSHGCNKVDLQIKVNNKQAIHKRRWWYCRYDITWEF